MIPRESGIAHAVVPVIVTRCTSLADMLVWLQVLLVFESCTAFCGACMSKYDIETYLDRLAAGRFLCPQCHAPVTHRTSVHTLYHRTDYEYVYCRRLLDDVVNTIVQGHTRINFSQPFVVSYPMITRNRLSVPTVRQYTHTSTNDLLRTVINVEMGNTGRNARLYNWLRAGSGSNDQYLTVHF